MARRDIRTFFPSFVEFRIRETLFIYRISIGSNDERAREREREAKNKFRSIVSTIGFDQYYVAILLSDAYTITLRMFSSFLSDFVARCEKIKKRYFSHLFVCYWLRFFFSH